MLWTPQMSAADDENVGGEIQLKVLGYLGNKYRPERDQKKAEEILKGILEMEKKGDFGWEKIKWETDAKKEVAEEGKFRMPPDGFTIKGANRLFDSTGDVEWLEKHLQKK